MVLVWDTSAESDRRILFSPSFPQCSTFCMLFLQTMSMCRTSLGAGLSEDLCEMQTQRLRDRAIVAFRLKLSSQTAKGVDTDAVRERGEHRRLVEETG